MNSFSLLGCGELAPAVCVSKHCRNTAHNAFRQRHFEITNVFSTGVGNSRFTVVRMEKDMQVMIITIVLLLIIMRTINKTNYTNI
jgi:hypothetical protein